MSGQKTKPQGAVPRSIERTGAFRDDYKREKRGRHRGDLDELLAKLVDDLAHNRVLPAANRDHSLTGEWKDHRECHIKPNLLLIYRKPDADSLQLVRLGSHSELFGK